MKKIRINELARELEVKPGVILDLLPELGVQEKKTHSSSIDEDVAIALKHRLTADGGPRRDYAERSNGHVHEPEVEEGSAELDELAAESAPAATQPPVRPTPPARIPVRDVSPAAAPMAAGAPSSPVSGSAPGVPATSRATSNVAVSPSVPSSSAQPSVPSSVITPPIGASGELAATSTTPGEPAQASAPEGDRPPPRFQPLRPPLGSGGALHPPLAPSGHVTGQAGAGAASGGSASSAAGQGTPPSASTSSAPINRNISIPARPLPQQPARVGPAGPGVTPAGPRQPLPPEQPTGRPGPGFAPPRPLRAGPGSAQPGAQVPSATAGSLPQSPGQAPAQPRSPLPPTHVVAPGPGSSAPAGSAGPVSGSAVPGAPIPPRPAPARPTLTPGAPIAPPPRTGRPPLAGQPAARPIVPPRPDLVQRLKQQQQIQPRPTPAAPAAPRPGAPARPSPAPGQPLYRGPIRPGQPFMRGPGGPGAPGGPGQGAPGQQRRPGMRMHPTTLRPESATPAPTEQQRRHQAKPVGRQAPRKREEQEGNLRERVSKRSAAVERPPIDREITMAEGITVKELSEKLGVKANLVIKKLVETKKIFATINQTLDVKLAEELAREFGASTNQVSYEEESTQDVELAEETKDLVRRAPVVTIMGHVDHGKTSLLDAIRQTNVAGREAGGITQHIGAYYIERNSRKIVFIDTPGHQAFTRMRARGAKVTDIVVLVVSADDGVMPQTLEAIDHARAAKVPIMVAINKIDKPDAQPDRVKQQLADRGLLAEDWGGDVVMVPVSAKMGQNLDLLLEMILLVADLLDLKANPNRPALGTVLEAKLDRGRGPVATMLVRNGTFRVGDYFICGALFSKVRAMFDDRGNPVKEAEPSMPVEVIGLESLPEVGDSFQVVSDTSKAKQIVIYREAKAREVAMAKGARVATLDSLHKQFKEGELKDLNLIIKADVGGTAEVLSDTLQQLSNEKVRVRVLLTGVGAITESDVDLASASEGIVIGFNVRPERNAQAAADQEKVEIRLHSIIYELIDDVKLAMTGLLDPVYKETITGHAEVRETFKISKVGTVAGCYVSDGSIRRDSQVRVLRGRDVIHTGRIDALKRFKNDASEVKNGLECGISLVNFNNIEAGDMLEAFTMERIAAELPVASR